MKDDVMLKIQRVKQEYKVKWVKGERKSYGPYWIGLYWKNGKTVSVYIGRELPKCLEYLLEKRVKLPGENLYRWPNSKNYRR